MHSSSLLDIINIPFPDESDMAVFQQLSRPAAYEYMSAMAAFDVVGFQAPAWRDNYLRSSAALDIKPTRTTVAPLGINTHQFSDLATGAPAQDHLARLSQATGDLFVVAAIERLDPAKNFQGLVRATNDYLEDTPEARGKMVVVGKLFDRRLEIETYRIFKTELDQLIELTNRRFGTDNWQPIVMMSPQSNHHEAAALMARADALVVNSFRDGLNRSIYETAWVGHRHGRHPVLGVSNHAGAAPYLGRQQLGALPIDPHDPESLKSFFDRARGMSLAERLERSAFVADVVERWGPKNWYDHLVAVANEGN